MSNYKNHWTNEKLDIRIGKLEEKTTYQIKNIEKLKHHLEKDMFLLIMIIINTGLIKQLKVSFINIKT